jgi:cyanophycinase-like exopeptidase
MSAPLEAVVDQIPAGHGIVGLLSSDEFLPVAEPFDRALLAATGPRVALVLAADPRAAPHSARLGIAHYRALGADPFVVDVLRREDATADALPPFDVLFLAGGDPARLLACLRDTALWEEALRRWRDGNALAGSSAGAMALCRHSLEPRPGDRVPTHWTTGLGPIERVGLAVHARNRPREWLESIAAAAPVPVVALDDGVGLILTAEEKPVVAGDGNAWVVDPRAS